MTDDSLSDDDKALFRQEMRSVKPLHDKTKRAKSLPPSPPRTGFQKLLIPMAAKKQYFLSDFIITPVLSESTLSFSQASIPSQRFRDLKNGKIPWEGRLDLHGFAAETAREALCQFIQTQFEGDKRCLLIIHGKGGHQGAPPVIKNLVNRWLPQFNEVLAFHSALARDGGHGALYVLLKKQQ